MSDRSDWALPCSPASFVWRGAALVAADPPPELVVTKSQYDASGVEALDVAVSCTLFDYAGFQREVRP